MDDLLQTEVIVQYDPETIACACIYSSARKLQIPLPKKSAWYLVCQVNETDIQDICLKIFRLYLRSTVNKNLFNKFNKSSFFKFKYFC